MRAHAHALLHCRGLRDRRVRGVVAIARTASRRLTLLVMNTSHTIPDRMYKRVPRLVERSAGLRQAGARQVRCSS